MTRDGARTLSDLCQPMLTVICEPCGRRGRYSVAKLLEQNGDAKLPSLSEALTDCPKARSSSVYDRCKAVHEGLQ